MAESQFSRITLTQDGVADTDILRKSQVDALIAAIQDAIAALGSVYQPLDSDLTAIAQLTTTAYGRAFLQLANESAGRGALGGSTIGQTIFTAANEAAVRSALGATTIGSTLFTSADEAAVRTVLSLVPGTNIQPQNAALAAIAANSGTVSLSGLTLTLPGVFVRTDGSYADPAWITSIASSKLTGTIDVARLPFFASGVQVVSTSATIAGLSGGEQAQITSAGAIVTTTDGRRWTWNGTGSKVLEASYVELADVTPAWAVIAGKPTTLAGYGITDNILLAADIGSTVQGYRLELTRTGLYSGAPITAAATTNLAGATGDFCIVWGSGSITSFGTAPDGTERVVYFTNDSMGGKPLLVFGGGSRLFLPGGQSIQTEVGDTGVFRFLGGDWYCMSFQRGSGLPVKIPTVAGAAPNAFFTDFGGGSFWSINPLTGDAMFGGGTIYLDSSGDGVFAGILTDINNSVWAINPDGSGFLANTQITWDNLGNLAIAGQLNDITYSAWQISPDGSGSFGTNNFFWDSAGNVFAISIGGSYWSIAVDGSGLLAANNIHWDTAGNFTCNIGHLSGLVVGADGLQTNDLFLPSTGVSFLGNPGIGVIGQLRNVNDALAPVVGSTVVGGGGVYALVMWNGTNWIVVGATGATARESLDRGTGTLSSGTATVSTSAITASNLVFLTINGAGTVANLGTLYEDTASRVNGTSFVVKSSNLLSNATFAWEIIAP